MCIRDRYKAGVDEYSQIADTVVKERDADAEKVQKLKDAKGKIVKHWTAPLEVDFDELESINKDVAGWLYMEALPDIDVYKRQHNAWIRNNIWKSRSKSTRRKRNRLQLRFRLERKDKKRIQKKSGNRIFAY